MPRSNCARRLERNAKNLNMAWRSFIVHQLPILPLEQHCHLNDMTGDYSCEKTKRQPLLLLQDWRCFFLFVIAQSRS